MSGVKTIVLSFLVAVFVFSASVSTVLAACNCPSDTMQTELDMPCHDMAGDDVADGSCCDMGCMCDVGTSVSMKPPLLEPQDFVFAQFSVFHSMNSLMAPLAISDVPFSPPKLIS